MILLAPDFGGLQNESNQSFFIHCILLAPDFGDFPYSFFVQIACFNFFPAEK